MSKRIIEVTDSLYDYILQMTSREAPALAALREETAQLSSAGMQISRDQGQFMGLLANLMGAERYLEIGTFTGYSALALALARPSLTLTCCDVSAEWTAIGRRHWERAGVAERIDLRLAPALETLAALKADGRAEAFDLCFIDADKENMPAYYDAVFDLVRPGGLIAVDNVLWDGAVVDADDRSSSTEGVRALNAKVRDDQRVEVSLVPIGDGLTLARKL
ncbi:MAG: O-methyltransferase [Rhodospirillales bacterium]